MPAFKSPCELDTIASAIAACKVSTTASEQAGVLVQGWLEQFSVSDAKFAIKAVEQPWYLWLSDKTLAVGVRDLVCDGFIGEWKTKKEPQRRKDGGVYKGQGPEEWAAKLGSSMQLAIYALSEARNRDKTGSTSFLVRAAVKSNPPEYWESNVEIPDGRAFQAERSFLQVADQIRALRRHAPPWRFPDGHLVYMRPCPCAQPFDEQSAQRAVGDTDPGQQAIEWALSESPERNTPDLVVLTASGHELFQLCPEAYRRSLYEGGGEEAENLAIGKAFHAGLAEFYRQIKKGDRKD